MRSRLDLLEDRIKKIIENSAAIFPWMDQHAVLTRQLVEAFHLYLNTLEIEGNILPSHFRIYMNNEEAEKWKAGSEYQNAMAGILSDTAQELGYKFENALMVELVARNVLKTGEIIFKSIVDNEDFGQTNAVPVIARVNNKTSEKKIRTSAYLMLDEFHTFSLDKPVINIGRRSSNHLVLDDLRVSRTHAQIRWVQNSFMIFDIGSTGGTYVNGERITQHRLQSGDVISLAGITMIYSEEDNPSDTRPTSHTSEMKSSTGSEE